MSRGKPYFFTKRRLFLGLVILVKNVKGLTLLFNEKMPVFRIGNFGGKYQGVNLTFSQKDACF